MIYVNGDESVDFESTSDKDRSSNPNSSNNIASTSSNKKNKNADVHKNMDLFWPTISEDIKKIKAVDAKNQNLPLARIKKIMKLDENAKMIAAEAPLLFAKACEIFIQELTLRAWFHTEDNKRRTLQRSDIATAISRYDQFDFLIDIVPREDIKPRKESDVAKSSPAPSEQVQYYLHLAQQQQQQQQALSNPAQNAATAIINQAIPVATAGGAVTVSAAPQSILLSTSTNPIVSTASTSSTVQPTFVNNLQIPQQQIQLLQQVVTPTGEITHVPITINTNQLNLLRMQVQGNNLNTSQVQQVIIPTLQAQQQQPSIVQVNTGTQNVTTLGASTVSAGAGGIFLNTAQHQPSGIHSGASVTTTGVDNSKPNTSTNYREN